MPTPTIDSVGKHIAWSYANLARAHAALETGALSYDRIHHMIRAKLFKGLTAGTMEMRTLYDDEKVKLTYPQACCYCGSPESLSIDHLIPQIKGGPDYSDNLVYACRSCNSSKRDSDLLDWCNRKDTFPSILLLRRYTKLVARYCVEGDLVNLTLPLAMQRELPFALQLLPYNFPPLRELVLWVPIKQQQDSVTAPEE
ncbi:hypothetical protein MNBD_PLANCTO02-2633 [hydrothermal vent metagenome]|uniref:HNH nuclease domain-containing protein n=1 Tax=hydrothermal vent metagenome TaxID=652676 RepID=A0A3B1DD79_9ZZZZ